ncbi:MAG: hypothetical protein ACOCRO_02330 [Halanaerobiales bacterium]
MPELKEISLSNSEYTNEQGPTNFYPEVEKKLINLINNKNTFTTEGAVKKEIQYFTLVVEKNRFSAECVEYINEDLALVIDAAWDLYKQSINIPEDIVEEILNDMTENLITSRAVILVEKEEYPADINDIKGMLKVGFEETKKHLDEQFAEMKIIVQNYINDGKIKLESEAV